MTFGLMLFFLIFDFLSESDLNGSLAAKLMPIMGLAFAVGFIGLWRSLYLRRLGKAGMIIAAGAALFSPLAQY